MRVFSNLFICLHRNEFRTCFTINSVITNLLWLYIVRSINVSIRVFQFADPSKKLIGNLSFENRANSSLGIRRTNCTFSKVRFPKRTLPLKKPFTIKHPWSRNEAAEVAGNAALVYYNSMYITTVRTGVGKGLRTLPSHPIWVTLRILVQGREQANNSPHKTPLMAQKLADILKTYSYLFF